MIKQVHSQQDFKMETNGNQLTSCVVINCVLNVSVSLMSESDLESLTKEFVLESSQGDFSIVTCINDVNAYFFLKKKCL